MSTTRDSKCSKILQVMTEVDDTAVNSRKRLKGMFLEKDKLQMSSYIKDLEKSLVLNKSIISDLISSDKSDSSPVLLQKKTIEKLNLENAALQTQLKKAIKQRDDVQSRLLICEQIVEELRGREKDVEQQYVEKSQDMLDQLNRKEYVLQCYEKRYHKAIALLKKYAEKDGEIRLLMREISAHDGTHEPVGKGITNVLEENEALVTEVKVARAKVAQLEHKFTELVSMAGRGEKGGFKVAEEIPRPLAKREEGDLSPVGSPNRIKADSKGLSELVNQLQVDKELIGQNIKKLQEENEGLTKLNAELSQKLAAALDELRVVRTGKRHQRGLSTLNVVPEGGMTPQDVLKSPQLRRKVSVIGRGGSFDDMSSIHEEFKEGIFFSFEGAAEPDPGK